MLQSTALPLSQGLLHVPALLPPLDRLPMRNPRTVPLLGRLLLPSRSSQSGTSKSVAPCTLRISKLQPLTRNASITAGLVNGMPAPCGVETGMTGTPTTGWRAKIRTPQTAPSTLRRNSRRATPQIFRGSMNSYTNRQFSESVRGITVSDKTDPYKHCVIDNGNGALTMTIAQPNGRTVSRTTAVKIPDGDIRVQFADDSYDPDKLQHRMSGVKLNRPVHVALGQYPDLHDEPERIVIVAAMLSKWKRASIRRH